MVRGALHTVADAIHAISPALLAGSVRQFERLREAPASREQAISEAVAEGNSLVVGSKGQVFFGAHCCAVM